MDVDEVLDESLEAVGPMAESRSAELRVEGDGGARVLANRAALSQILMNLLDNALKYGPPGQTVTISVDDRNEVVRFRVDDDGPGIPPRDRTRIWEPYRRLPRDVSSRQPGTGIGLAVVARLAAAHGGRARVEDAPGGGARFVVELPRAPASSRIRERRHGEAPAGDVRRGPTPAGAAAAPGGARVASPRPQEPT